jgi:hypothetical protein
MSELLATRLSAVRDKHVAVAAATGCAIGVSLLLVWTMVVMWIDWNVANGLPLWVRAILLVLEIGVFGWILYTRIIRPVKQAPDDEDVALMIERRWPDFKTRLIASVQLTDPEMSPQVHSSKALVGAMVRQTEELADKTPVTDVVATQTLTRALITAVIICIVSVLLFLWTRPASATLLQRVFLVDAPLPTKTQISKTTGNLSVALGDPLKLSTTASGYLPAKGKIELTFKSGRYQELELLPDPNEAGVYSILLDAVQEAFTYSMHVYDAHSETYTVTALERPAIVSVELTQIYPAYTGYTPQQRQSGDLALLAGSKLKMKVISTKPLRSSLLDGKSNHVLRFVDEKLGRSDSIPLVPSRQKPNEATLELPDGMPLPAGLNALQIRLLDTDGLESKDTAVYPVEIVPDRTPTVRIFAPERKEELVTAQAKLGIGYIAEDDIRLGKVTLKYKTITSDTGEEGVIESIALPFPPKERSHRETYLWDISKIPIPSGRPTLEGTVVEYWVEVEDTNNLSGPGRSATERYAARVVTRAEKQAEMMARSNETITTVKSASEDQEDIARRLGTTIHDQPSRNTTAPAPTPAPVPAPPAPPATQKP